MTYTCPKCGRVSHHPKDAEFRYCAVCGFADVHKPGARERLTQHLAWALVELPEFSGAHPDKGTCELRALIVASDLLRQGEEWWKTARLVDELTREVFGD
jgi:ribosomal protein L37E